MPPKISVIIPVYNGEKYLRETLDSIIHQTFSDFELLLIDDASTDGSFAILNEYANADPRVRVFVNNENKGIAFTTNYGIEQAQGEYIALSDQDDVSFPERLERQVNYLKQHPDIDVLGTQTISTGPDLHGQENVSSYPITPGALRWMQLFGCIIANSTVMMRIEIFIEFGFRYGDFITASDYDMFARLAQVSKLTNLPIPLIYYRRHQNTVSKTYFEVQRQELYDIIRYQALNLIGENLSDDVISGIIYPRHQKKQCEISSIDTAQKVSLVLAKLATKALKWELSTSDRIFIRQNAAGRIRRIWKDKHYHPFLLPCVLYTIILDPDIIRRKLSNPFHHQQ